MMEHLAGDAHISFEGDLSDVVFPEELGGSSEETEVLKRNTLAPRQDFIVLPLKPDTVEPILKVVLRDYRFQNRIVHIQIEREGRLEFGAYDNFDPDGVVCFCGVPDALLDRLMTNGVLASYMTPAELEARRHEPLQKKLRRTAALFGKKQNCTRDLFRWIVRFLFSCMKSEPSSITQQVVRYYQPLGFFRGQDPRTVAIEYERSHEGPIDPSRPWLDAYLLAHARGGTWCGDPEADVHISNPVYTELLEEWAAISEGAFRPSDIAEEWESEEGSITVRFNLDGREVSVSPKHQLDWIDLNVLQQINRLIAGSGRQFECYHDGGNFALVMCLTPGQKAAMQNERRFPFAW
jgi:hypothetical protein